MTASFGAFRLRHLQGHGPCRGAVEYTVIVAVRNSLEGKQFLMVRHRERGWELPGGKVEVGEGPVHCALREFREETGHLLGSPHFVGRASSLREAWAPRWKGTSHDPRRKSGN
jgi:8-oxo-dGTP pyrophosphatase MutT (NUDIX family)